MATHAVDAGRYKPKQMKWRQTSVAAVVWKINETKLDKK